MIASVKPAVRLVEGNKLLTEDGWREVVVTSFGNYACGDGAWFEEQNDNPFSWPSPDVSLEPDQLVVYL